MLIKKEAIEPLAVDDYFFFLFLWSFPWLMPKEKQAIPMQISLQIHNQLLLFDHVFHSFISTCGLWSSPRKLRWHFTAFTPFFIPIHAMILIVFNAFTALYLYSTLIHAIRIFPVSCLACFHLIIITNAVLISKRQKSFACFDEWNWRSAVIWVNKKKMITAPGTKFAQ